MSNSALSPINSELLENIINIILDYKDKSFNDISSLIAVIATSIASSICLA